MNMDSNELPNIVQQSFTKADLNKLVPSKGLTWTDQFKAFVNIVPWVGGFTAQEIQNIQDYKVSEFCRKYTTFIYGLQPYSEEERDAFCQEIEDRAKDYSGNVIMGIVDRLDNVNKQLVLANITNAKIKGLIRIEDFFRLTSMLERIPYVDLKELPKYEHDYYDDNGDTELLYATGALRLSTLDAQEGGVNKFVLSPLGCKFLRYGLGINVNVEHKMGTNVALNVVTSEDIDALFESKKEEIIEEARPKWEVDGETLIVK